MGSRFAEIYAARAQPGGVFGTAEWDAIFQDIDLRIVLTEDALPRLNAAIEQAETLVLARLNETLLPAIGKIQTATELGFLVASSATSAAMAAGNIITFVLSEGAQRDLFQPSAFVNLTRLSTASDYAVARVRGFDREHGELLVEIVQNWGAVGPFADWQISASAGVVPSVVAMLADVRAMRQAVAQDLIDTRSERAVAAGHSTDANAAATRAKSSEDAAKAAADRAAVWDPANYATKASPIFTGDPKAPTPALDDKDASIATTEWVLGQAASGVLLRALTSVTRFLTPKAMADAMAFVTEAATATIALNFALGFNRLYTMGLNATVGQPTGMTDGLPVVLYFQQDATGGRTIAFNATYHKFPGGVVPTLSTTAGAVDRLAGICRNRAGTLVVEWSGVEQDIR